MHELPIVKEVLEVVLRYARNNNAAQVRTVVLEIGGFHDLVPEWVEKYFHFASRGTLAEGAAIRIIKNPVILHCNSCGENVTIDFRNYGTVQCTLCNSHDVRLISGKEFMIREIEIQSQKEP